MVPELDRFANAKEKGASMATKTLRAGLVAGILFAPLGPLGAQEAAVETQLVDAMIRLWGVHAGFRANHAKGLVVIAASPPDAPKPTKFDQFVAAHPSVPRAGATAQTPGSFADEEYHGINAFVLINDKGERRAVRYIASPEKLVHLDTAEAAKKAPDFLVDELPARLAHGPVTFHLKAQLASPGDSTKDPSQPWPDSDEVVELGMVTIDKPVSDSLDTQKKLLFLPGQLTDGIEASDDPMIEIRNGAYAVSFSRRAP
jgi:catalase